MTLCRDCHNPEESCECDQFAPMATSTEATWTPTRVGTPVDDDDLLRAVQDDRRPHVARFLESLRANGCSLERPTGKRDDYVNVRPPTGFDEYAICVITRSTGRIQFRPDSYSLAREIGRAEHFDALEADKAAINLDSKDHIDAAIAVAKAMLDARRGTG